MEKMQEIFKKNAVACDGIVACSVEDWNFIATTLTGLFDKAERIEELKEALQDLVDGESAYDLVHTTGWPLERCQEIIDIAYKK